MTTLPELAELSGAIHDEYFNLEHLDHRPEHAEMRLPMYAGREKKGWIGWTTRPPVDPLPPPLGVLVVRNVLDVVVEDEADIGWYDVSGLSYDSASGVLRIVSNVPCEIVVRCRALDVELLGMDSTSPVP